MKKVKDKILAYDKEVTLEFKIKVGDLLSTIYNEVPFKYIVKQLGFWYMGDGARAMTGLPIVTNEKTVEALGNGMICKYMIDHWEEIKKQGFKYYKKLSTQI